MVPAFGAIAYPFDHLLLVTWLLALAATAVWPRPRITLTLALVLAGFLALGDQSRWQAWFYQYVVMLGLLLVPLWSSAPEADARALSTCRFAVGAVYFWSGFHKLNSTFVVGIFPDMVAPFVGAPSGTFGSLIYAAGLLTPFVEMGMGIGLLSRRFRLASVMIVIGMHAFILGSLGPLGRNINSVVWPWNVAMVLVVVILFGLSEAGDLRANLAGARSLGHRAVRLLFGVLPFFCMFNLWDSYLSFTLYSGNKKAANIFVSAALRDRLPAEMRRWLRPGSSGRIELAFEPWSGQELNVPLYPEVRVFKQVARAACRFADNDKDVILESHERGFWVRKLRALVLREPEQRTVIYDCRTVGVALDRDSGVGIAFPTSSSGILGQNGAAGHHRGA